MNIYEKIGLLGLIFFFTSNFPKDWLGGEIIFFIIPSILFIGGKFIEEAVEAFRTV